MAGKKTYLAFLLILAMLVFAGCARYDGMPDGNTSRDRVIDNRGIQNDGGISGTDNNGSGNVNNWNNNPNSNTPGNGLTNNNNLNR